MKEDLLLVISILYKAVIILQCRNKSTTLPADITYHYTDLGGHSTAITFNFSDLKLHLHVIE